MANKEKVLKGLWACASNANLVNPCIVLRCPYIEFGNGTCIRKLSSDALEVVKEQEETIEKFAKYSADLYAHEYFKEEEKCQKESKKSSNT